MSFNYHIANSNPPPSPTPSDSSFDDDEANCRVTPYWQKFRGLLKTRGFRLDTVRDVKEYYKRHSERGSLDSVCPEQFPGFRRACQHSDDDDLCPDAGLLDNLFRGTRSRDGLKVVVKAVNLYSREYEVIRLLSSPPLRDDPMNHTIPILDLIDVPRDRIAFIVMEEWSSQLIPDSGPCCLSLFLAALRQCIEHAVFLHRNHIAHLDISLRNLLTDYNGRYAYIDYELSRRFSSGSEPLIYSYRGTEVPPECERMDAVDAYKIDVWALAILILRACQTAGYHIPELMQLVGPMLYEDPRRRPPLSLVLQTFDRLMQTFKQNRVDTPPSAIEHRH
ncbi:hypothetical protein BDN72DRAFT_830985 [Pluteus cervinus]|uniref:Uncharacterized protein n=1 Tax=Pluteus cervinus TaxID=181527 RepID=A0ACD3BEU4_9AGAR|nr:hypothetical protein BDN72DRAFT_830985 [Pluteus cervinus]